MHSANVSGKHLSEQTQFKFIVKKEFVSAYGIDDISAVSGFDAKTLKVTQHPSIFSPLNTLEQIAPGSPQTTSSLVVGIIQFMP